MTNPLKNKLKPRSDKNGVKKSASKKKGKPKKKGTSKSKLARLSAKQKTLLLLGTWIVVFLPTLFVYLMLLTVTEDSLPSLEELENPKSDEASQVLDFNGVLLGTYFKTNRTKIDYQDLSPYLVDALVATEDERYWTHSGVDGRALARAITGMGKKGGGSTITQQLAKMMFHEKPETKIARIKQKFAEWKISVRLENSYSKQEIIAMYFNEFDFLYNAVGVHSAARIYFGTTPDKLKIEEAATLVRMAKNPFIYNPKIHPEKSLKGRNQVLKQMYKNNMLTKEQKDSLQNLPLVLDFNMESHNSGLAPYFRAQVMQTAKKILAASGKTNKYGKPYSIFTDGLKIYTTLDSKMQKHAEWAMKEHLSNELQAALDKNIKKNKNYPYSNSIGSTKAKAYLQKEIKNSSRYKHLLKAGLSEKEITKNFNTKTDLVIFDWNAKRHRKQVEMTPLDSIKYHLKVLRAGLVSIDPHTGYVKAFVGGPDYRFFKYDYATTAKRQVGSTIKPFVYAAAIESGVIDACYEAPMIRYCIDVSDGKQWCPGGEKDYDEVMTPAYYGLANSSNPFTAHVINKMGGKNSRVVQYFDKMGIKNNSIKAIPSLGLGVCELSVMEMTSAHAVFTDYGLYHNPIMILRIEDANGNLIWEETPEITQVMSKDNAYEILRMMKGVTGVTRPADGKRGGTARRLKASGRAYKFSGIMAGKTGTTQSNADGWFIGHTPDLVTGVWVGCDSRSVRFSSTALGQGANTALPIWGYYMQKVYRDKKIKISHKDFPPVHIGETTKIECVKDTSGFGIVLPSPW